MTKCYFEDGYVKSFTTGLKMCNDRFFENVQEAKNYINNNMSYIKLCSVPEVKYKGNKVRLVPGKWLLRDLLIFAKKYIDASVVLIEEEYSKEFTVEPILVTIDGELRLTEERLVRIDSMTSYISQQFMLFLKENPYA